MKNIATGTEIALLAGAIAAYPIVDRVMPKADASAPHAAALVAAALVAAAITQAPPVHLMEIEWTYYYWNGFLMCGPDQTAGGGPVPEQRFRATSPQAITSIGSCDADVELVSRPRFENGYIECGGFDSAAIGTCLEAWRGSCNYSYPGEFWLGEVVITSDAPIWTPVLNGVSWDNGVSAEGVREIRLCCPGPNNPGRGIRFTRCRMDFDANGILDGGDVALLLYLWDGVWPRIDLDASGRVDGADLAILLNAWGPCPTIPEASQCIADLVLADRQVNGADLGALLSQWGTAPAGTVSDINRDGQVNGADLGYLLNAWGPCPN